MNTLNNTLNGLRPNPIVPIGSDDPEPLYISKKDKLYVHIDLLETLEEFFPPTSDFKLCNQTINGNWGKESVLHRNYRCCVLPILDRDTNKAIEDVKWLCGIFLGELKRVQKKYITMIAVKDRDYEVLKHEDNPTETVIKIVHQASLPRINTYQVIKTEAMKYRLNRDGYRICYECGEEKELISENFYCDKSKAKGFQHICIKCVQKKRHQKYHGQNETDTIEK